MDARSTDVRKHVRRSLALNYFGVNAGYVLELLGDIQGMFVSSETETDSTVEPANMSLSPRIPEESAMNLVPKRNASDTSLISLYSEHHHPNIHETVHEGTAPSSHHNDSSQDFEDFGTPCSSKTLDRPPPILICKKSEWNRASDLYQTNIAVTEISIKHKGIQVMVKSHADHQALAIWLRARKIQYHTCENPRCVLCERYPRKLSRELLSSTPSPYTDNVDVSTFDRQDWKDCFKEFRLFQVTVRDLMNKIRNLTTMDVPLSVLDNDSIVNTIMTLREMDIPFRDNESRETL